MPTCQQCGTPFTGQRSTARFCSARCRLRAHRGSADAAPTPLEAIDRMRRAGILTNRFSPFIGEREVRCDHDDDHDDDSDTAKIDLYREHGSWLVHDMHGPGLDAVNDEVDFLRLMRQRLYEALFNLDDDLDAIERNQTA